MTPAERKKLIQTINARATQLLTPYGIRVTHTEGSGHEVAEFTFRVPEAPADSSKVGKYSELIMHLDSYTLSQYHTSAECLDKLPLAWAHLIIDYAPELFESAPLPTAAEVDWRPTEMIPEDFSAM
ncbi:MAG: hypothetical protein K2V38_06955 [Gemmataceae bacterium]|nr:hypothetical protein [Gemmataceae bacterium]